MHRRISGYFHRTLGLYFTATLTACGKIQEARRRRGYQGHPCRWKQICPGPSSAVEMPWLEGSGFHYFDNRKNRNLRFEEEKPLHEKTNKISTFTYAIQGMNCYSESSYGGFPPVFYWRRERSRDPVQGGTEGIGASLKGKGGGICSQEIVSFSVVLLCCYW